MYFIFVFIFYYNYYFLQYPKILPKSNPPAESSTTIAPPVRGNGVQKFSQNKLNSTFSVKSQSSVASKVLAPANAKQRSSTPSEMKNGTQQIHSSSPASTSSVAGMKPLRPYGTTASPYEVANAAKMLKRIEDMKGNNI